MLVQVLRLLFCSLILAASQLVSEHTCCNNNNVLLSYSSQRECGSVSDRTRIPRLVFPASSRHEVTFPCSNNWVSPTMAAESQTEPQQSWAAWFLDAYANAVVTEPCEVIDDDSAYESMSPAMSDVGKAESASPYGPYVKTGKGGAGNYQWQVQQNPDVEAQRPTGLKEKRKAAIAIESIDTAAAMRNAASRKTSQYARSGRGGAGNFGAYVQSNEPQASPTAANFWASAPASSSSPVMHSGRGGAGNLGAARSASESVKVARERHEEAEAAKRREQAEHQVGTLLQPPSQAHIGSRRRSTLPDEFGCS